MKDNFKSSSNKTLISINLCSNKTDIKVADSENEASHVIIAYFFLLFYLQVGQVVCLQEYQLFILTCNGNKSTFSKVSPATIELNGFASPANGSMVTNPTYKRLISF